jgi:dTDP-4-amino-4,6-dideoxygalactose transaminase
MRTLKQQCEAKICKKLVSKTMKLYDSDVKWNMKDLSCAIRITENKLNNKMTSEEETEAKLFFNKLHKLNIIMTSEEEKTEAKILLKMLKFEKNKNKIKDKTRRKFATARKKDCKQIFCNPGCKDTLFESGKKLPKSLVSSSKPIRNEYLKRIRKEIFGKKTNVLVDDFYEKIKPAKVAKYKKDGAISGCLENDAQSLLLLK